MVKSEELKTCKEERRRLKAEILRLEAAPHTPATKLKLLLAKRDLQDLIRRMRLFQAETAKNMSQSTAVTQAINAYGKTVQVLKKQGR